LKRSVSMSEPSLFRLKVVSLMNLKEESTANVFLLFKNKIFIAKETLFQRKVLLGTVCVHICLSTEENLLYTH
jgi:hypothetical protein